VRGDLRRAWLVWAIHMGLQNAHPNEASMVSRWIEIRVGEILNRVAFIAARALRTKTSLAALVTSARNEAEALTAEVLRREPAPSFACHEGCDACCYQRVALTGPEVIVIAVRISEARCAQEVKALIDRLAAPLRKPIREPCPLLYEGRCTVYEFRPLRCQGHSSVDARSCNRLDHLVWLPQEQSFRAASGGIALGAARCGVGSGTYELKRALLIALTEKDVEARYLNGDGLFTPAELRAEDLTPEERAVEEARIRREQRKDQSG
jgi:Fe-S-cluster containining protein